MRFSIIIPVYNVEQYIRQCIDSALNQTFNDYEIILIDDGSLDKSGEICDEYAEKYQNVKVYHQKNQGLSVARNEGVLQAQGDYIWFLDSDDIIIEKEALELINKSLEDNLEIVHFGWKEFANEQELRNAREKFNFNLQESKVYNGENYFKSILSKEKLYQWYACIYVFKKEYWLRNNYKFLKGKKFEDVQLIYKVVLNSKSVKTLNRALYGYRVGRQGSIVTNVSSSTIEDGLAIISDNINELLKNDSIDPSVRFNLLNNFACIYFGILIMSTKIDAPDEEIVKLLQDNFWVSQYCKKKKQRIATILVKCVGIRLARKMLYVRRVLKYGK